MEAASFAALSFGLDEDDVDDLLDIGQPDRIIPALARSDWRCDGWTRKARRANSPDSPRA